MIDMPVKELLAEFGKGKGMPGSGGATILSAMAGIQLLVSVCKLTRDKERYSDFHEDMAAIQSTLETKYLPLLAQLMEEDRQAVHDMLRQRILRDKVTDPDKKREHKEKAIAQLQTATDSMLTFCRICLDIIPMALQVYRDGQKSAKGDTIVALSNLLSGASSGLFTALVNIQNAHEASWVDMKRSETEIYFGRLHEYQYIFNGKLAAAYNQTKRN